MIDHFSRAMLERLSSVFRSYAAIHSRKGQEEGIEAGHQLDGKAMRQLASSLKAAGKTRLLIEVEDDSYTVSLDEAALRAKPEGLDPQTLEAACPVCKATGYEPCRVLSHRDQRERADHKARGRALAQKAPKP